jgi:hypothetical protein
MNEGEEYKILDCSDKPVRIFSTLIECSVTNNLWIVYYSPLCSRCGKCCDIWLDDFLIKLRCFMDDDLFLFGVLVQRLSQVLKEGLLYINSIPCVYVHLSQDKSR